MGNVLFSRPETIILNFPSREILRSEELIDKIVSVLVDDPIVLQKWERLANSLKIRGADIELLRQKFHTLCPREVLMRDLVQYWYSSSENPCEEEVCEALRSLDLNRAAAQIEYKSKNHYYGRRIIYKIPKHDAFFGREQEMSQLTQYFEYDRPKPVCIFGSSGYGKTLLASTFAQKAYEQYKVNAIFLNGDSKDKLSESLREATKYITGKHNRGQLDKITDFCSSVATLFGKTILIVDNVDDTNALFEQLLNHLQENYQVFIVYTTKNKNVINFENLCHIELGVFPEQTSLKIVNRFLPNEPPSMVKELCDQFDNYPLLLMQAVVQINREKIKELDGEAYNIRRYLCKFNQGNLPAFKKGGKISEMIRMSVNSITNQENIFREGMAKAEKVRCVCIVLYTLSYLDPTGVHKNVFGDFCTIFSNVEQVLKALQTYCVISAYDNNVFMHRMRQNALRMEQRDGPPKEISDKKLEVINNLLLAVWKFRKDFEPDKSLHIVSIIKHAINLGIELDPCTVHEVTDRLIDLSLFSRAVEFCEFTKKHCNLSEKDGLKVNYNLARVYTYMKDYVQAKTKFDIITKLAPSSLPSGDQLIIDINLEYASFLLNSGDILGAKDKYTKLHERLAGKRDKPTESSLRARHGVAICLLRMKRPIDALPLFEEVYRARISLLTGLDKNPASIRTLCYIGECYYDIGKYKETREHMTNALEILLQTAVTSEHDLIVKTLSYLSMSTEKNVQPKRFYQICWDTFQKYKGTKGKEEMLLDSIMYTIDTPEYHGEKGPGYFLLLNTARDKIAERKGESQTYDQYFSTLEGKLSTFVREGTLLEENGM